MENRNEESTDASNDEDAVDDEDDETSSKNPVEPAIKLRVNSLKYKPYFVYLMAASASLRLGDDKNSKVRRMSTHIGKSREPVRKVLRHNEGLVNSYKRSTRSCAPNWRLEEWIGPFQTRHAAREFQKSWFKNTKGVKTRVERGVQLASEHKVICYTPRATLRSANSETTT